ncbi:CsgG/HfaB family protein [Pelistega suis]|uniref:CsgG/HfaB family protein n=1 Tax=Pelistega suis TaxID=1631957 RepID=A0A849P4A1_9BURK|nr:CsgG/HfaB family protein [Pelistega suis]NOL51896.1 CsgG/HfaB family protein [Pelistega suis]
MKKYSLLATILSTSLLAGCAIESHRTVETHKVASYQTSYHGPKSTIAIGKFTNRSQYQQGVFSNGTDRLGSQANTILQTHLHQTGRFSVLDRSNLDETQFEAKLKGQRQQLKGAKYIITGDVTEFGRKTTGDKQLFGILGSGKTQTAYAKVNLNVVDTQTGEVIYASQGAGEYSLSSRELIGFGSTSGYDSTLNGKVLELAIRDAVNHLVTGIEQGHWHP